MLEITKMLTLSTAHISESTSEWLSLEPETNHLGLSVYEKTGSGESYGWFIYLTKGAESGKNIPDDLKRCMQLARDMDAGVLCLDCDGPVLDYLPQYEWDG